MRLPIFFLLFSLVAKAEHDPSFSFTYNVGENVGFLIAQKIVDHRDTFLPFHFDANWRLHDCVGLSMGLVYRYESYNVDQSKPLYTSTGYLNSGLIWTNYHEVFLLGGPRFSLLNTGLNGLYFSLRAGLGLAISPKYLNFSVLAQPEFGYSLLFQNGLALNFGLGVLLNLPFYENVPFMVPWDPQYIGMSAIGVLVHQATPIINIGLGFNM